MWKHFKKAKFELISKCCECGKSHAERTFRFKSQCKEIPFFIGEGHLIRSAALVLLIARFTTIGYFTKPCFALLTNQAHQDDSNDTPQPICEFQVDFPLLWIKDSPGLF